MPNTPTMAGVGEQVAPSFHIFDIEDIPDQGPYVQAGMAYLRELYDLKALFGSFDMVAFTVQSPIYCVLAQAMNFEMGDGKYSYYDFIRRHVLPATPEDLGFAIQTTLMTPMNVDAETGVRLDAAWKSAIGKVLAE